MIEKLLPLACALLCVTGVVPSSAGNDQALPPVQASTKDTLPKPQDLNWDDQQVAFAYGKRASDEQCAAQPTNLWCSKVRLFEEQVSAWTIMNTSLTIRSKFIYLSDVVDTWRVHSSEAMLNQYWKGDCDDLTSTTLDILIRKGQPRSKVWFVLADVEHKSSFDHLIGMVQDKDGHFWIVGDTSYQNAYPVDQLKYRIVAVASASQPSIWFDPHALKAFPDAVMQSNPILPKIEVPKSINIEIP